MAVLDDNVSGYKDRVRRWVRELESAKSFWSDDFLLQQINVTYRKRCAELEMAHEGYFINVALRNIEADKSTYAWPNGFERLKKLELVRSDGTTVPLDREERHFHMNPAPSAGGDQYCGTFRPIGGGFVLEPTPTQATTNGLRLEYFGLPAMLEVDGDSWHTDFPRTMDELIILDTVVSLLDSEGLFENGLVRSVLRSRQDWEYMWERYIDHRIRGSNKIHPFVGHFADA